MIRETGQIPAGPFLTRDPQFHALRYTIVKCLFGADRRVVAQAKAWDLKFMAVSDLNGQTVLPLRGGLLMGRDLVGGCFGVRSREHRLLWLVSRGLRRLVCTLIVRLADGGARLLGVYC
jgi:hypothetical protein